jgi:hypothetical protein
MPASTLASLAALAVLICALPVRASHRDGYVFTFDTTPDSYEWSHTTTFTTARFPGDPKLGPFTTATVTLSGMDYLRGFGTAYLQFDLFLNGSWAGTSGDDHFIVVANGQTVLDATFSNLAANSQSYPTLGSSPGTGSFYYQPPVSGYRILRTFTVSPYPGSGFPGCCTDVGVSFRSTGPGSWYLDDVVVSSTPIPEPHPALLVSGGLFALGARRRLAQSDC